MFFLYLSFENNMVCLWNYNTFLHIAVDFYWVDCVYVNSSIYTLKHKYLIDFKIT